MCATCGCSDDAGVRVIDPESPGHGHGHGHEHPGSNKTVVLEQDILAANNSLAAVNRGWLAERKIHAVNLMSSPGSGKTTLLERTIRDLARGLPMAVIEGDQETVFDAERIKATGCRVIQVNTGAGCHLDADMLAKALRALEPANRSTVFVENVGNLVCPALFDLGERSRVVIMSVTEGADKPLKYPHMFRTADVVLLNKMDLLPYVDFDLDVFSTALEQVNQRALVLRVSTTGGEGLDGWYAWLRERGGLDEQL
ncbi:hydrogenase nickel incorporation protein HypB [Amycolatopsis pittospori]|uniref:hydrogenase nickel incorporation protein HypB n=1 Tax=Amycolatopsis pittospori TaxID=2749434 RepID=UPI0015F0443B|nr:hydrogenase nickel incorporation protein HypB [Amycolatopsis pittospori]